MTREVDLDRKPRAARSWIRALHFHKWYVAGVTHQGIMTDILWKCRKCKRFTVGEVYGHWSLTELW